MFEQKLIYSISLYMPSTQSRLCISSQSPHVELTLPLNICLLAKVRS